MKTFGGKFACFVACVVCIVILLGAATAIAVMADNNFYTRTPQELYNEIVENDIIAAGYDILHIALFDNANQGNGVASDFGNLTYQVTNYDTGEVLLRSESVQPDTKFIYVRCYFTQQNEDIYNDGEFMDYCGHSFDGISEYTGRYVIYIGFVPGMPYTDVYSAEWRLITYGYSLRYWVFPIAFVALALAILCFVLLMRAAGRKKGSDALHPGVLHAMPFDLLLALCAIFLGLPILFLLEEGIYAKLAATIFTFFAVSILGSAFLGLCMSISVRLKDKSLLKNTVIYRTLRLCKRIFLYGLKLPLIWRTVLITAGICFTELLVIGLCWWEMDVYLFFWFAEKLVLLPAIFYFALCLHKLQRGGDALAAGNLSYQTDVRHMIWNFKRHGEHLNSIALGMNAAVEERLKSERMKTELITNVSHDLKTPLTSIINYAGLIADEPCENEKISEYAQVLSRQSERLKRLIEDLVEASKAATGNLEVNLGPCDAAVFLTQTAGEYATRLHEAGLTLITKQPEQPVYIMADGRRMLRIFDNLMGNICKYAQPDTRVYLTLEVLGDSAVISFRNTSRQQLNISEEELMERFVRGDSARSTEGNGLGLSIARSLTELQGGTLRLFIDGDLFKCMLIFPRLPQ